MPVLLSERVVRRSVRWGRRWFPQKGLAPPITDTAVLIQKKRFWKAVHQKAGESMSEHRQTFTVSCPIPLSDYPNVLLAHGSGGKLTHQLIEKLFRPAFQNPYLNQEHDGAVLNVDGAKLAFTTDSYVVHPLFFPGGDIGSMAIYGTVNDLAMCGAKPLYLSAGFIIEEGLRTDVLARIVDSMKKAAERCSVELVTGDTKVVDRGKGDGIFINTAGIGIVDHALNIAPRNIRPGDKILLNGDLG